MGRSLAVRALYGIGRNADRLRKEAEQLIRDAGYDPVNLGGLESARALEDFVPNLFSKVAPIFYRFAAPGNL